MRKLPLAAGGAWTGPVRISAVFIPHRAGGIDFLKAIQTSSLITGRVYNADQMPPYTL